MTSLVYILILHWRGIEHTRNCLLSVTSLDYPTFKILLVDNGSDSFDGQTLQKEFPSIELLRLPENKGFSGGCNAGIDYCIKNSAEFIWLLNNDAVAEDQTLKTLVAACAPDEKIGAAAAAVSYTIPSNPDPQLIPGRGVLNFVKAKALLKPVTSNDPVACQWLAASNLLLRASAVRAVGPFDDRYFLYFEDTELCHKLNLSGWKCLYVPGARIQHEGNKSTGDELKHWRAYYYTRNRLLFFSTYAKYPVRVLSFASIYMHMLRHCLVLPFSSKVKRRQLKAELLGVQDFLKHRFGRCENLDQI